VIQGVKKMRPTLFPKWKVETVRHLGLLNRRSKPLDLPSEDLEIVNKEDTSVIESIEETQASGVTQEASMIAEVEGMPNSDHQGVEEEDEDADVA
jgi:hypothetical protein